MMIGFSGKTQVSWSPVIEISADTALFRDVDKEYWQILEDPSGKLDLKAVSQSPLVDSFYHLDQRKDEPGIHTCWFRFRLKNTSEYEVNISLSSQASRADFYILSDSSATRHLATGVHYSWANKDGLKRINAVPLVLNPDELAHVYFRWHKINADFRDQSDSMKLRIFQTDKLQQRELDNYESGWLPPNSFPYSFLFGFFVLATILNFLIFLAARERLYLYFSFFLLAISISNNPLFTEILPREYPLSSDFISRLSLSWLFFVLHFVRHYFRTFERFPRWDRFMVYFSILFLINLVVPPFPMDFFYRTDVILIKALILALYVVGFAITVIKCLRNPGPGRNAFMLAALPFILLFLGTLLVFVISLGSIDMNQGNLGNMLNYLLGLSVAWLVVMFSWYLYKRYAGQQKQITEVLLEKERAERKAQEEKNELIARQKNELEQQVIERTADLKQSLEELKSTQAQLIHSEKMASLGELTAGIAHEIQNPLNFVNNFAELNQELLDEFREERKNPGSLDAAREDEMLKTIKENQEKILLHGRRADSIVKGMLQHSQSSTGQKELTDINALADEYLRLAYHGLRAKDKWFNAVMKTDFDQTLPKIQTVPQDIGRVLLNLYNNAFSALSVALAKEESLSTGNRTNLAGLEPGIPGVNLPGFKYSPTITITTKNLIDHIEIHISDNGPGIPPNIIDKIFQPFFTTKPTGQGTGLGLSMAYDIIKAHGGSISVKSNYSEPGTITVKSLNGPPGGSISVVSKYNDPGTIDVNSRENVGTTFIIQLPIKS